MTLDILRLLRDIALRTFAIGAAIGLLQVIATLAAWGFWTSLAGAWWHTDEQHLSALALGYFSELRFFLVFLVLIPGLALHWTVRAELRRAS